MEELKEWGKRGLVPPGARGILSCKSLTVPYLFLDESAKEDLDSDETISAEEDDEEEGSGLAKKNWVGFL
ncbi:hypothetical protein F2Q69_00039703 [Brassica cretica]|uniref:Uncharacterized protein n=1 Tax=Brassica cretica TaxID=69181 RepID=A0A8S9NMU8_BRACR|nr:hypothetical protein F2Q69_00039703 [Brassica cretica]